MFRLNFEIHLKGKINVVVDTLSVSIRNKTMLIFEGN